MGVLMVSVVAFLQLISRVLSSAHRSSLISCVRSARRRWRRAKTKTVRAGRKRRNAAASFNAKVPKKDVVNLSGLRTAPHRRQHQSAAHLRYRQLLKLRFPTCTCVLCFSKYPYVIYHIYVFLHIFRMKLSQSPSSFRSCQVTLAHFQLSLPVCDQLDALRQKVRRRQIRVRQGLVHLWPLA